ncbi:hypothetical protein PEBR_17194 [Penicillium brasilianum]|uniref:Uncharacterized protein n=1 Tax=Penicillium brasilianum TaxID=104259 RepID=A0A1S9RPS5_PENBI|nr:hypothetical protein PEBR_17194 [Penicillium brasilianum]
MSNSVEDLVRRLRQEPERFLRAFATPDENNQAFTIKGLLKAVYQLGHTEEDLMKAAWLFVGFLPGFVNKESDASSSAEEVITNEAAEPIGDPQVSIKAPIGLYRFTKPGDKTGDPEVSGFFELRPHKSGWNHRTFIIDDQAAEAEIRWAGDDLKNDAKQVWRLSTAIENGAHYDLGFWVDFEDAVQPFKFAGTVTAGGSDTEKVGIEGVMDDDLYASFGGFFGHMIQQFKASHEQHPSPPQPELKTAFGAVADGPGSSPATGVDIASGAMFPILEMIAMVYLNWVYRQNLQAAPPPPQNVVPVQTEEGRAIDEEVTNNFNKAIAKLEEIDKEKRKPKVLEACNMKVHPSGDDKKDPNPDPGTGGGDPSTGHGRTGRIIAINPTKIFVTARHTSNQNRKACDAVLDVVGQPLRERATELIMDSLTRLNEEHQVVEPAKNPIIDWPTVIQSAINKTCPKAGDPARTIAEFQDAYLVALRQSIGPILMSYLAPLYASLSTQPGTSDLLHYFSDGGDFANYNINDAILKAMASEKVYPGIISETIRAALVKQKDLGPSTSTTPGGGPGAQESFDLQLQGLQTISEVQQDYAKKVDSIAKLLESGALNIENAEAVLREKLDMVAIQPGMYAPAAPPNQWYQTADALGNMGLMVGLSAGYRGSKGAFAKGGGGLGISQRIDKFMSLNKSGPLFNLAKYNYAQLRLLLG